VEPPPWLHAKIMAQVRAAAEPRPSLWRRLFLPFHVKLSLEALALVFICVTGYYLARTNAPQSPLTVSSPAKREEASAPAPPAHRVPRPASAPPKALSPPPRAASGMPAAAPRHGEGMQTYAPPPPAKFSSPGSTSTASTPESVSSLPAPDKHEAEEWIKAEREAEWAARRDNEYAAKGMMRKKEMLDEPRYSTRASGGSPEASNPLEFRSEPSNQAERPERTVVALSVDDPDAAAGAIEQAVRGSGGRIVRRSYGDAGHLLFVQVESRKVPELMDRLERIGNLRKPLQSADGEKGTADLTIMW
jgi:hypothetical protein